MLCGIYDLHAVRYGLRAMRYDLHVVRYDLHVMRYDLQDLNKAYGGWDMYDLYETALAHMCASWDLYGAAPAQRLITANTGSATVDRDTVPICA